MSTEPPPPLARERTSIAWTRTALGAVALGILLIRFGLVRGSTAEIVGGAAYCLIAVPAALTSRRRHRDAALGPPLALPVVTVSFVLAGVLTLIGVVH